MGIDAGREGGGVDLWAGLMKSEVIGYFVRDVEVNHPVH